MLTPLSKNISLPLRVKAAAVPATDAAIQNIYIYIYICFEYIYIWIRHDYTDNLKRRNERYDGNS